MNSDVKPISRVTIRNSAFINLSNLDKPAEIFSFNGLYDDKEHVLLALGDWKIDKVPLVRLHSECLTGDVFHSLKCDCGQQLNQAIEEIYSHGGFLIYLRQEGRGIGLYNKIDAYRLQNEGVDTYKANNQLGFPNDLRDYKIAAEMLKAMKCKKLILLSNNPDKKRHLESNGIQVLEERTTGVFINPHNQQYIRSKVEQSAHKILCPS